MRAWQARYGIALTSSNGGGAHSGGPSAGAATPSGGGGSPNSGGGASPSAGGASPNGGGPSRDGGLGPTLPLQAAGDRPPLSTSRRAVRDFPAVSHLR